MKTKQHTPQQSVFSATPFDGDLEDAEQHLALCEDTYQDQAAQEARHEITRLTIARELYQAGETGITDGQYDAINLAYALFNVRQKGISFFPKSIDTAAQYGYIVMLDDEQNEIGIIAAEQPLTMGYTHVLEARLAQSYLMHKLPQTSDKDDCDEDKPVNTPRLRHLNLDHTTVVTSSDQLAQHDTQVALVMQEFEGRHLTPIVRTTAVTETVEGRTSVILVTTITR